MQTIEIRSAGLNQGEWLTASLREISMNVRNILKSLRITAVVVLGVFASGVATALDWGESFELHGYGHGDYEQTNVDAKGQGRHANEVQYDNSLVGVWKATNRTSVWACH